MSTLTHKLRLPSTPLSSQRKIQLLFLLLAGFQLAAIAVSLFDSYRLEQHYSRALLSNEHWSARRHMIAEMDQLTTAASMPGTEEFRSHGWEQGQKRMHYAADLFLTVADNFAEDVRRTHDSQSKSILPATAALRPLMQTALDQADEAYSAFQAGNQKLFQARLIYTDRAYRRVSLALGGLREQIFEFEDENLKQQADVARQTRAWNNLLAAVAVCLVAGVVLYARRLQRQIQHHEAELRSERAVLEQRVLERTTELRREIDERKQTESSFRSLVQNAPYGMLCSTPAGELRSVNPALMEILGYASEAELLSVNVAEIYQNAAERARLVEHVQREGVLRNIEIGWKRKGGAPVQIRLSCRALPPGPEGALLESFVEDVTEQRTLEQQLRQAQKMEAVGRLAGGVAHDFNNVLMVISGYAEMLCEQIKSDRPLHKMVQEIEKAAGRAASLTRQLLAFSRQQVLAPSVLNLNDILREIGSMLQRLIGEDIELIVLPDPTLGRILADSSLIQQILMNLVVNARDAMPNGGKLLIETANVQLDGALIAGHPLVQKGPYVMLAVTDTGTGMDKETQSHIFEPFFTTKDPSKGTGLGLSIVYGGVKQSGGYTCVYSELGRGTTFKVYLPRVEKPVQTLAPHKVRRALGGPETILLVEDEATVQSVIRDFLQSLGYRVLIAGGPAEAIDISKRHAGPIHLLLTDVVMPAMNGCQLAAQVEHPNLKVLYMSGYTHNAITCFEKLHGDQAFLQKPFALDILARRIDELLHRPGRKEVQSVLPLHDTAVGANA